jgi:hypothetical protein
MCVELMAIPRIIAGETANSHLPSIPGGIRRSMEGVLLGIFDDLVQFLEKVSHVGMMDIRTMFQLFIIGNLALKTGQFVFFENRKGLGITTDYLTNDHIFVNHARSLSAKSHVPG